MSESSQAPWWSSIHSDKVTPRTKRRSPLFVAGGFTAIVATMVGLLSASPDPTEPFDSEFGSVVRPASALETVGQCGGTFSFDVPRQYSGEVPEGFFDNPNGPGTIRRSVPDDPMIVPAYGYFVAPESEPKSVFLGPDDVKAVPHPVEYLGYLWDGWTIIWYDAEESNSAVAAVQRYVSDPENDKVMAMPWNEPQGRGLPLGRTFGFSSWGMTMSCELWDERIADNFVAQAQSNTAQRDTDRPYPARLDTDGELVSINVPR